MEEVVLKATPRNVIGKQVRALRREGQLPAILYGSNIQPTPVLLDLREAMRKINHLGSSALVTIEIEGARHLALIREKQRNHIKGTLNHIDFQVVSMREKLRVNVPLEVVGESPAVVEFDGVLVSGVEQLSVEALPGDLPSSIRVDISQLANIGDALYVRDITLPANVVVLDDPETMVALITAPTVEVEEPEEEEVLAEPEVIEKGKKEEEEEGE